MIRGLGSLVDTKLDTSPSGLEKHEFTKGLIGAPDHLTLTLERLAQLWGRSPN